MLQIDASPRGAGPSPQRGRSPPGGEDQHGHGEVVDLRISTGVELTPTHMRQALSLLLCLLVLSMFFPTLGGRLEAVALNLLNLANAVITTAAAGAGTPTL